MDLIQISERIRDHLTQQKAQSLDYRGGCAYRGENGTMCAVGCLITDKAYTKNIESISVNSVMVGDALLASGVALVPGAKGLLSDWQRYHDSMCSRGKGYSYNYWIRGAAGDSPENFHNFIIEHYQLKGATPQ